MTRKNNTQVGYSFSPKQQAVLEMLVGGASQAQAARETGTEPATVSRWLKNPIFKSELQRRRVETLESIRAELSQTVRAALAAVRAGLNDAEISPVARLQCAGAFLGRMLPGLLRLEPEAPDVDAALKAEAERRRERFTDSVLDGTSEIEAEARSELEADD